ncbi:LuxR C-terminal-related transcriptional regulator [Kribbella amoyensis]|nr:LuxR C-terminal-related transcriptional regulator [Kribbella amoyensis]
MPRDPPAARVWVERPGLMRTLDEAVRGAVTLVVAPAGAGKTLTLARWTSERAQLPVDWIRTGSGIDPQQLADELRAAAVVAALERRLSRTALSRRMTADLAGREAERLLVIDDAHLMAAGCFTLLDELIASCPTALRIVLICRWDPPLDRLVPSLQGELTTIRGRSLRMSRREAAELVLAHGKDLPAEAVAAIVERARGWPALIVLAARTVAGLPEPARAAEHLSDGGWLMADQLTGQVFSALAGRARHLLLCVASEETVTVDTAVWLSGDPRAGESLAELEESGLLVSREYDAEPAGPVRYRIHPLLSEVLRRQSNAGGVDVLQARAMLGRAARWDVANGDLGQGFRRLVAVRAWDEVVELIAERGMELLMLGQDQQFRQIVHAAPEVVDACPRAWATLAIERMIHGDPAGARHWKDRLDDSQALDEAVIGSIEVMSLRLAWAWSDAAALTTAVDQARALLEEMTVPTASGAWLLVQLGTAENWLGQLTAAQGHLRRAATAGELLGLPGVLSAALSHLALTEYLEGRYRNCCALVDRVLELVGTAGSAVDDVAVRARIVRELARSWQTGALVAVIDSSEILRGDVHLDPATAVLRSILDGRIRVAAEAKDLDVPVDLAPTTLPWTPAHLAAALLSERCVQALLGNDRSTLVELTAELDLIGADAEATVVRALCVDLSGDREQASATLEPVVDNTVPALLSMTRWVALVCQAQLKDSLGYQAAAESMLREAIRGTAPHGVSGVFFGWSLNGTPTYDLLHRIADQESSPWLDELCDQMRDRNGWKTLLRRSRVAGSTGSSQSPGGDAIDPAFVPGLTHREHDVLVQLAGGNSYADIAVALFISENTVKTHVSSLYSKLGASGRSRALKIARTLELI